VKFPRELLTLETTPGSFAICRGPTNAPLPEAFFSGDFVCVTKTKDELSVVCEESRSPPNFARELGWSLLKVRGPLDFGLVGILSSLTEPLSEAGLSVFAVSTYETDYLLLRQERLAEAVAALRDAGFTVHEAS